MVISHDTYASGLTVTSGDIDTIASLAAGAYAIVDKDPESATYDKFRSMAQDANSITLPSKFQFVTMTANGLKWSPIITKATAAVVAQAYVAPQAKTMTLNNTVTGIEVGKQYGFIVTDLTKPQHDLSRNRTYIYTAVSGATEAIINAALIALVNADTLRVVNASATTDILLTGITAGEPFTVSLWGDLRGQSVVSITQAHILGTGTAAQLIAYEKVCNVERGDPNYRNDSDLFFSAVSEVTVAETYDTYTFRYTTETHRPIIGGENPYQELVVALLVSLSDSGNDKSKTGMVNVEISFNG